MTEKGKTNKRILMVAPTPFFADRGCHVRILGEAKALQDLGHQVIICTYHLGTDVEGLKTVRTWTVPWYKKLSAGPSIHKFYIDLFLLWKVLHTCWRFRPDVIHAHLHEGIVIGKIASLLYRCPLVADLQGSLTGELLEHEFIPQWNWLTGLMKWTEKKINQMPSRLIASSTRMAQLVTDNFGFEKQIITTIRDGVNLEIFYPTPVDVPLKAELGISPADKVVVFMGVLTEYQGIDLLLEAICQVVRKGPKTKFLIIGYPEEAYQQKANALGIEAHTIFTGKVPYADTPKYLALGDIATSPKISATEANLKLFTYMAMRLPTVVFESPVNREILGNLGAYADYGEVESLAQTLMDILQDDQRAKELGDASYRKALADYSWDSVGRKLEDLYEQVNNCDRYSNQ